MRNLIHNIQVFAVIAVLCVIATAQVQAAKKTEFIPPAINSFDGTHWGELTLNESTRANVTSAFHCDGGSVPESVKLRKVKKSTVSVELFFANKKADATLLAVRVNDSQLTLPVLETSMNAVATRYFENVRYEDWFLCTFPGTFITAFANNDGKSIWVPIVMLTQEKALTFITGKSTKATPISSFIDPDAGKPKVLEFGNVRVTYSLTKVNIDQLKDTQNIESLAKRATAGGTIRYRPGADGVFSVSVTAAWDSKRGGTISVSDMISGQTVYGAVAGNGSSFKTIPASLKNGYSAENAELAGALFYALALAEAQKNAEDSIRSNIGLQGPPPISSFRIQRWEEIVKQMTIVETK